MLIGRKTCFITAILALAPFARGAVVGSIWRIVINKVSPTVSAPDKDTGIVSLGPAGSYYFLYYAEGNKTESQVLAELGWNVGSCIDGSPYPNPNYEMRDYYVVGGTKSYPVTDASDPNGNFIKSGPLGPIYNSTSGLPFLVNDYGYYNGLDPNFDLANIQPLQGNVQPNGSTPQYVYYDSNGMPQYSNSPAVNGGNQYIYVYNESTGWTPSNTSFDGSSGDITIDVSSIVEAVNNQGGLTRDQLVSLLGSSGNSWVYDCKLSLLQLYDLASSQGLVTRPQINLSSIQSSLDAIAAKQYPSLDLSGLATESTLSSVDSRLSSVNSRLASQALVLGAIRTGVNNNLPSIKENSDAIKTDVSSIEENSDTIKSDLSSIKDILTGWDGSTIPSFSGPDFGSSSPDSELPYHIPDTLIVDGVSSLAVLSQWGQSGAPSAFDFDIVSGLLQRMVGSIPSVGSDSTMFTFDCELPFIGHISKTWSFEDIPFIGEFRQFCLWLLYLFFGLAMFKTLHATIF